MKLEDKICYCYGVPLCKLLSFARRVRPRRASQMTECLGAGTGCGWCVPFLIRIARDPDGFQLEELTPEEYADQRRTYNRASGPRNTFDAPAT